MPEYGFDLTLTATVRVDADDLAAAVAMLTEQLHGYGADWHLPGTAEASGRITELSLGVVAGDAPTVALFEVDGDSFGQMPLTLDGMTTPVLCDQAGDEDEDVACHVVYDEARGDGYLGACPAHADASEPADTDTDG